MDNDQNLICDIPTLENFLTTRLGQRLELIDPVLAARQLRGSKVFHKSEWALTSEDQITSLIPNEARRKVLWPHIRRFSWVAEAIAANARLGRELGSADGMFWHYHPVTFMQHMNGLEVTEDRALKEAPFHDTNVELSDDYFLTKFVNFDAVHSRYVPANVDQHPIRVSELSNTGFQYQFTRAHIACMQPGNHSPETTPPQSTKFSLALLDTLESIHQYHGAGFQITLSYMCAAHFHAALCVMNAASAAANHNLGIAADIQPANATAAECRRLWNSVAAVVDPLNVKYPQYCGMPSQADLPGDFNGLRYTTSPGSLAALTAHPQQNVPAADVHDFRIHLELIAAAAAAAAAETTVNLRVTLVSLEVLQDQPSLGDWEIKGSVRGGNVGSVKSKAQKGQVIALGWSLPVTLSQNDKLDLTVVAGYDSISPSYDRNSNPAWGIGTQSAVSTVLSSFRLSYKVEWDQSDF
jgi:hypothetical protein